MTRLGMRRTFTILSHITMHIFGWRKSWRESVSRGIRWRIHPKGLEHVQLGRYVSACLLWEFCMRCGTSFLGEREADWAAWWIISLRES
jgi:hypothetical protein